MSDHGFTRDELDHMAGAYYTALHCNDASTPWERLEDWQRHKHRRGVVALITEARTLRDEEVDRGATHRQSRTVRLERRAG